MSEGPFTRRAARGGDDQAMLPMINVVLLLLVFFMVAGTLRPPAALPVTPATADGVDPERRAAWRVALAADGALALDGRAVERPALLAAMAQGGTVSLVADANATAGAALALAQSLQAAGAGAVHLVVVAP